MAKILFRGGSLILTCSVFLNCNSIDAKLSMNSDSGDKIIVDLFNKANEEEVKKQGIIISMEGSEIVWLNGKELGFFKRLQNHHIKDPNRYINFIESLDNGEIESETLRKIRIVCYLDAYHKYKDKKIYIDALDSIKKLYNMVPILVVKSEIVLYMCSILLDYFEKNDQKELEKIFPCYFKEICKLFESLDDLQSVSEECQEKIQMLENKFSIDVLPQLPGLQGEDFMKNVKEYLKSYKSSSMSVNALIGYCLKKGVYDKELIYYSNEVLKTCDSNEKIKKTFENACEILSYKELVIDSQILEFCDAIIKSEFYENCPKKIHPKLLQIYILDAYESYIKGNNLDDLISYSKCKVVWGGFSFITKDLKIKFAILTNLLEDKKQDVFITYKEIIQYNKALKDEEVQLELGKLKKEIQEKIKKREKRNRYKLKNKEIVEGNSSLCPSYEYKDEVLELEEIDPLVEKYGDGKLNSEKKEENLFTQKSKGPSKKKTEKDNRRKNLMKALEIRKKNLEENLLQYKSSKKNEGEFTNRDFNKLIERGCISLAKTKSGVMAKNENGEVVAASHRKHGKSVNKYDHFSEALKKYASKLEK